MNVLNHDDVELLIKDALNQMEYSSIDERKISSKRYKELYMKKLQPLISGFVLLR